MDKGYNDSDDAEIIYFPKLSEKSIMDLDGIFEYIAVELKNPESAIEQCSRIEKAVESLSRHAMRIPLMDREMLNAKSFNIGYRQLLVDNYSVIYFIDGTDVIVARIIYTPANIKEKL